VVRFVKRSWSWIVECWSGKLKLETLHCQDPFVCGRWTRISEQTILECRVGSSVQGGDVRKSGSMQEAPSFRLQRAQVSCSVSTVKVGIDNQRSVEDSSPSYITWQSVLRAGREYRLLLISACV
jgi:hypothetical protein